MLWHYSLCAHSILTSWTQYLKSRAQFSLINFAWRGFDIFHRIPYLAVEAKSSCEKFCAMTKWSSSIRYSDTNTIDCKKPPVMTTHQCCQQQVAKPPCYDTPSQNITRQKWTLVWQLHDITIWDKYLSRFKLKRCLSWSEALFGGIYSLQIRMVERFILISYHWYNSFSSTSIWLFSHPISRPLVTGQDGDNKDDSQRFLVGPRLRLRAETTSVWGFL